jgi:DNA-binding transcriptional regulator GbsR (MarR family)
MKANPNETKIFSDSIDKMNEAIEEMIELYNGLEEDLPLVEFEKEVLKDIEKAKKVYGDKYVNKKINAIVKEVLSWLPLDEVEKKATENNDNKKK